MTSLQRALLGNAAFSGISAALFLGFGRELSQRAGLPHLALQVIGVALLGFVALLLYGAFGPQRQIGRLAVKLDWAWVVGSAIALALPLTAHGRFGMVVIAGIVTGFALWQGQALKAQGAR